MLENNSLPFTKEDFVYSKIGAAIISAQRVEFLTSQILSLLEENGEVYGVMTDEFLANTEKSKKLRKKTLGQIFKILKLNPTLVLSSEMDEYIKVRNQLVHNFLHTHLHEKSNAQMWKAINFCYAFGRFSNRIENFFQGFLYFLALRNAENEESISTELKRWYPSLDYFLSSLQNKTLQPIDGESIDAFD